MRQRAPTHLPLSDNWTAADRRLRRWLAVRTVDIGLALAHAEASGRTADAARAAELLLAAGTRATFSVGTVQYHSCLTLVVQQADEEPLVVHAPVSPMAPGLCCEQIDELQRTWIVGN